MSYSDNYDHIDEYIKNTVNDDETLSLVSDFAILWNLYEGELYNECYNPRTLRDEIVRLNIMSHDGITNDINSLFERLKAYLNVKGIFDFHDVIRAYHVRPNDIHEGELEVIMRGDNCIDKLNFMLLIAARVRNNMFHGIKGISDLKNQKELFRVCNSVLKMTIDLKMGNSI